MRKHSISFHNAAAGFVTASRTQINLRIHLTVAIIVFIVAVYLKISLIEGLILLLTVSFVLVAELFNTAIEFLSDAVTLEENKLIGHAKDVSAGAVLVSAIFAALIGLIIFVPKILHVL